MRRFTAAPALLLAISAALAQGHGGPPAGKAPGLLPGLGDHRHPIATKSPEAQRYFDQGLRLVFAFNHEEAVRAFRRAAALDPRTPMPLWGEALALGPNINMDVDPEREKAAHAAVLKALALAAAPEFPENERDYVSALAKRYSDDPGADLKSLAADYADAMRELAQRYPDDLDVATLFAESLMDLRPWKLWTRDGEPAEGTEEILAVLESVLKRDPDHPGANHYYIHAVEASPHPEMALPSAARLEKLMPGAGHLVHMPSHIYQRTGDYAASAKSNRAAAEADRAYIRATRAQGVYPLMYYSHNLHFLSAASAMEGRFAEAKRSAGQLVANVAPALAMDPMPPDMLAMVEVFSSTPAFIALRFQRWDEFLALPRPGGRFPVTAALWHYARGLALSAKGDLPSAEVERRALAEAREALPEGAGFGYNTGRDILKAAGLVLDARIAEARGRRDEAIAGLEKAVEIQDRMAYNEPADWYYPIRETLGGALLRSGRPVEAEAAFREDLARNPRNPRSLFGLWTSLKTQKRTADADWVRRQFEDAWKNADVTLQIGNL